MTRREAARILGLPVSQSDCDPAELKKRYRQLLHLVHPDGAAFREKETEYPYEVHEIQLAYGILSGEIEEGAAEYSCRKNQGRSSQGVQPGGDESRDGETYDPDYAKAVWDAKENPRAFCQREILQYLEDYDGTVLGYFTLVRGRYLWQPEEEFPLFLMSISKAVTELIAAAEEEADQAHPFRERTQKGFGEDRREEWKRTLREKLTYLLTQQFIDASESLKELVPSKTDSTGAETIYAIPAMLEVSCKRAELPLKGEPLLPGRMEHHRLFLKNRNGTETGYLSFPDDRMYYLIVPLFEQRRVQVKIRMGENRKVQLWLKFKTTQAGGAPEDLNWQIQELLEQFRQQLQSL